MKNLIKFSLFSFLLAFSFSSIAQTTFGARIGLNIATVKISAEGFNISPDSKIGLTVAGVANIGVSESLSVQPELHFIQKGYKIDFGSDESTLTLNYLELPVNVKYNFTAGTVGAFVFAGPSFGFAVSGKEKYCDGGDCNSDSIDFDDEDGFQRFDAGVGFGGGVTFGSLFVDVRYNFGLTNLFDEEGDDSKVKNRGFQVGVGYWFGGGE